MEKKRIIIDTDPGIDDALAILLAIASPEIKVEALTVSYGNCSVDQGVRNAPGILELVKENQIPVARGAAIPLVQALQLATKTHGSTGCGYAKLPDSSREPVSQHAVDFIINHLLKNPGEISLVAIGPLTNLALAIRLELRIVAAVKEVYIMGGAIQHGGNMTPLAEFNVFADPHAAHIVFHAGFPITLIPLDVTYKVILTRDDVANLLLHSSPVSWFISEATRYYIEFHNEYQDIDGCAINDPLALALCFNPEFVKFKDWFVDVDISGGISTGKTFADIYNFTGGKTNMRVAYEVDTRKFINFFLERMGRLAVMIKNR